MKQAPIPPASRPEKQRYFLGLGGFPVGINEALLSCQDIMRENWDPALLPHTRWTRRENLHLTLRFLGWLDTESAQRLCATLKGLRFEAFSLKLYQTGAFKTLNHAYIWAGIKRNLPLLAFQQQLEAVSCPILNLANAHQFTPHISLARVKGVPKFTVKNALKASRSFETDFFPITEYALYVSEETTHGRFYRPVQVFPLF